MRKRRSGEGGGEEEKEAIGASKNTDGIRRMINYWWRTWPQFSSFIFLPLGVLDRSTVPG